MNEDSYIAIETKDHPRNECWRGGLVVPLMLGARVNDEIIEGRPFEHDTNGFIVQEAPCFLAGKELRSATTLH